jgi:Ca2+-binding RTX toxin-like protein
LLTVFASVCLMTVIVPVAGHAATVFPCFGKKATIVGTPGNDVIVGTHGVDVIRGLGGNDKIYAGGRRDYICGGRGADRIHGDKASPTNYGHVGNDRMSGGRGDDRLMGEGMGSWGTGDIFVADPGDDHITEGRFTQLARLHRISEWIFNKVDYSNAPQALAVLVAGPSGPKNTIVVTGYGNDTIDAAGIGTFSASAYDDDIDVQGFMESLSAMGGNDHIFYGTDGNGLQVFGDDGNDNMTFINGRNVEVAIDGGSGDDTIDGAYQATGDDGNDTMIARDLGSELEGGNGSDTITGGPGPDGLIGGPGDDILNGRDGITGNDTVDGGDGTDACTFDQGDTVLNCP